jgi:AAA+ superfamily ATPase
VQEVTGWEKAINSLLEDANTDIYVTGSNSKLLSGEISGYLTGRYIFIPVYTLSFSEYLRFKEGDLRPKKELLQDYIRMGGFPIVARSNFDENSAYQLVEGIYNSVINSDITRRYKIVNFDLFQRVVKFIVENVGKTFSANAIAKFLKSEGRSLSIESIYNYISYLEKAFVIYRCPRYDLQGKSVLKTQEKYYLADPSLKYCIMGFNPKSVASMLENLVYFELKRRGYEVYIGKNETKEIDFVAVRRDERIYVQVCRNLPEDSDRELTNLLELKDHYPKYLVTLDDLAGGNVNGVKIVHFADFLLSEEY